MTKAKFAHGFGIAAADRLSLDSETMRELCFCHSQMCIRDRDYDPGGRKLFRNALRRVRAGEPRHGDIEDDDVRSVETGQFDGLIAVGGFGDNPEVALALQEAAKDVYKRQSPM